MTEKRNCPVCGAENTNEYEYCIECGAKLPVLVNNQLSFAPQPNVANGLNTRGAENNVKPTVNNNAATAAKIAIYCAKCGFGAEEGDNFCNRCGASLYSNTCRQHTQQPRSVPANNYAYYNIYGETDLGVDDDDLRDFVGPNADSYSNKFKKMKYSGSKASWNWPVFLFSFLLNIPFVWFFYRKMYKVGSVLLAITLALSVLSSLLVVGYITPIIEYSNELVYSVEDDTDSEYLYNDYEMYLDEYYNDLYNDSLGFMSEALPYFGGLILVSMVQLAYTIIVSILANNMYYKHCVNKIKVVPGGDKQQRRFLLFHAGGTSLGAAIATGVIVSMICGVINVVFIISAFMIVL